MKTLFTKLMTLAMVGIMGLSISSCTEEDLGPGTSTHAADSLEFTAMSSTSVKVRWKRGSGDSGPDTIVATPVNGGTAVTKVTASNDTSYTVTGLQANTTYNFQIQSNGTVSASRQWAPALRLPSEAGNSRQTFRIYETADNTTGHPSGLALVPANAKAAATEISINASGAVNIVDFVLSSRAGIDDNAIFPPGLAIIAADVTGSGFTSGGRKTAFANTTFFVKGGLDEDFYGTDIAQAITTQPDSLRANIVYIDDESHDGASLIIPFRTAEGYYGRLEVVPQSNGKWYGSTSAGYYVDVRVSLQTQQGVAYVGRPIPKSELIGPMVKGRPANRPIFIGR